MLPFKQNDEGHAVLDLDVVIANELFRMCEVFVSYDQGVSDLVVIRRNTANAVQWFVTKRRTTSLQRVVFDPQMEDLVLFDVDDPDVAVVGEVVEIRRRLV